MAVHLTRVGLDGYLPHYQALSVRRIDKTPRDTRRCLLAIRNQIRTGVFVIIVVCKVTFLYYSTRLRVFKYFKPEIYTFQRKFLLYNYFAGKYKTTAQAAMYYDKGIGSMLYFRAQR